MRNFYTFKEIFKYALLSLFTLASSNILVAQTAVNQNGQASAVLLVDGIDYQGYCIEYHNGVAPTGHNYTIDATPEIIINDNVTACMNGQGPYGTSATQGAIWYFTDNINPSSGSNAWSIIERVNDNTYGPMCATEWLPSNNSYQDIMCADDPYCQSTSCDINIEVTNNGCCDALLYHWVPGGDILIGELLAGQTNSFPLSIREGDKIRAINVGDPVDWHNLIYDEHYEFTGCDDQSWSITPDYCPKEVSVVNDGCCPLDIYEWLPGGDEFLASVDAGQTATVYVPSGNKVRVRDQFSPWNNLIFDEDYMVPDGCGPFSFTVNPIFCAEITCPDNITIECDESIDPANTGNPITTCGDIEVSYEDEVTGDGCNTVITRTWTLEGVAGANPPVVNPPYVMPPGSCDCQGGLLVNPSFDNGTTSGWHTSGGSAQTGGYSLAECGPNHAYLRHPIINGTGGDAYIWQQVENVIPGEEYSLQFYSGTHRADFDHRVGVSFYDANGDWLAGDHVQIDHTVDGCGCLQYYSITGLVAPPSTSYLRVYGFANGNYLKLDEFCLNKSTVTPGTQTGSFTFSDDPLVVYTMEQCNADNNFNSMQEFQPTYPNGPCSAAQASGISNYTGEHSCVSGAVGNTGFCVDAEDGCDFNNPTGDGSDDRVRFEVYANASPDNPFRLSGLSFYEKAPLTVEWDNNSANDFPTLYGVRIQANGVEVFVQADIPTTNDWTLETFDFLDNIVVTTNTTFTIDLLGYCKSSNNNNGGYELWDLDEVVVYGGCGNFVPGNVTCNPEIIVGWDLEACESYVNQPSIFDYSEFVPVYPASGGLAGVQASNLYRNDGWHSCNPGVNNQGTAMCISFPSQLGYSKDSPYAVRLEVSIAPQPGQEGLLTELNFFEKAASTVIIAGSGEVRTVDYPLNYGVRVTRNGQEIFEQIDLATSTDWSRETIDFSNNPAFIVTEPTIFIFEILGYNFTTGEDMEVWDLDNLSVQGCSRSVDQGGGVTCVQTITVEDTTAPVIS